MKLDSVLTVAVGRDTPRGVWLLRPDWDAFRNAVRSLLAEHGVVVAAAYGEGVGSDGINAGEPEDTAVFVVINPKNIRDLRSGLASLLRRWEQSSACFALDSAHEPVWASTPDGSRPKLPAKPGEQHRRQSPGPISTGPRRVA